MNYAIYHYKINKKWTLWRNSNINYDIYSMFIAFPLNLTSIKQVAQLSQRDRAAGWVSYGQKWKAGTGRQYLRTL